MTDRRNLEANGIEQRLRIVEASIEEIHGRLGLLDEQARQGFQAQLAIVRIATSGEVQGSKREDAPAGIAHLESMVERLRARIEDLTGMITLRRTGLPHREVA
jgi:hypothetical protein